MQTEQAVEYNEPTLEERPAARGVNKRTVMAAFLILVMIPATMFFGITVMNDRQYYLISMLIIACSFLPFIMVFERRRPQARELMVIAVMVAITVAGRAAFFMLPQFKPLVAIVIIAAVSFGPEAGFLTGAVATFVSNFFFGQGPWTPWQMFACGIIGFIAGLLFKEGRLPKNRVIICVYGGLATLLIYGVLLNFASLIMWTSEINKANLIAIYASGLPMDMVHAVASVIFLAVLADPMLEKLERIKIKYGLIER